LRTIDSPFILSPTKKLIHGTRTSLETILQGGKVYSHCAVGRHRSVAMGAAILIAQGHTPETAIKLIKNQRPVADPDVFYVRHWITVFAKHWRNMKAA
jgi:protein-tyrosine phosphatase